MVDLPIVPIPPRNTGPAEIQSSPPAAPKSARTVSPDSAFQEKLLRALNQIGAGVDQVGQSTPTFQDMQQVMEQAKSAFTETMHAHLLMQSLTKNAESSAGGPDSGSQEG
ncbi:MAG TPA: hypothetical protein PK878_01365 [bacterium]|nr:hypothetical protein [Candidatus Omnitrophota bacterium]HOJ58911.1 hypothetical protein [bacterium]HOL93557.1 hypothetical protein [bacterium]HPP00484.1 hypothetical protein [bacterium]HXK95199.1 hypothetical protein [bacterium]